MRQKRLGGDNQLDCEAKGKDTTTEWKPNKGRLNIKANLNKHKREAKPILNWKGYQNKMKA